ncbi:transcriptional regulator [Vibrio sp. T187]|uniref:winged helix-turn-helix domain-containing protein n=1 Tax=Vibrio TaxID=662 RepID=UPI0010CA18EA|nr:MULTISPECIES: winged helix-turn-helix domain-containing protein [Vibrio]MBW3697756.1 transcriptional regulator [Vibrio sp. T187]
MSAEFIVNDDIQVDLAESEIHHIKTGRTYPIGSNESELLKFFFEHPNEVITRQVLIDTVWVSKGIFVEDGSLMQTISICRKALEDKNGSIIVTERGKGYRFSGDVKEGRAEATQEIEQASEQVETKKSSKTLIIASLIFIASAVASHFTFNQINKSVNKSELVESYYLTCTLDSDELSFNKLYNVTLYEYKDRKIIIDSEGKSLSFPREFEGVTCE